MRWVCMLLLLSLPTLAVEKNDPAKPVEVPGDETTGSSAGYHNTEMNSAGPSTDFSSTIIRSEREEAMEEQRRKRAKSRAKKAP